MSQVGIVVLMGAPGSGKGTQAKTLGGRHPGWIHVSTGDLFRREISSGSSLGNSIKDILAKGHLVSDEITNEVFRSQVLDILNKQDPRTLILDGYPRTESQARSLMDFCRSEKRLSSPILVEMRIGEDVVVKRLADRLVNPRTGRIYHRTQDPPRQAGVCDDDGGPLIQRSDDQPETIRARYRLYEKERNGIVAGLGLQDKVSVIEANAAPELVSNELEKAIAQASPSDREQ